MIKPKLESIYRKSVVLDNLLDNMTIVNINVKPSRKEYLSDIYILLNIYEYITQSLHYKLVSTMPAEEENIRSCTYIFRVCRDIGILNNEERSFMVSFCYLRNKLCHTYEEVNISDVYSYVFNNREYINHMIALADDTIQHLDIDMNVLNYNINEILSSNCYTYEDILKATVFQFGRLLSIKECIEIKNLIENNNATEDNIMKILSSNMSYA